MEINSSSPKVSIIVPSYNYGHFLINTLENIKRQTYEVWECLIVDDGSTDNTKELVWRYVEEDWRIKYLFKENGGLSSARNVGIQNTDGKYILFLDADDGIEEEKLKKHVDLLEQYDQIDIVYSNVKFFDTDIPYQMRDSLAGRSNGFMTKVSGRGTEIILDLFKRNIMVVNAALIRRSVISEVGLFDEKLKAVEDWDYWTRCAMAGKYFHYEHRPNTSALVRVHQGSMSHSSDRMFHAYLDMVIKFLQIFKRENNFNYINSLLKYSKQNFLNNIAGDLRYGSIEVAKKKAVELDKNFPSENYRYFEKLISSIPQKISFLIIKFITFSMKVVS